MTVFNRLRKRKRLQPVMYLRNPMWFHSHPMRLRTDPDAY